MMYTYEKHFADFLTARDQGERCQIDQDMFYYWLEVLPPVYMQKRVRLVDGTERMTSFGFAEGIEPITAFWSEREPVQIGEVLVSAGPHGERPQPRYFAQRITAVLHRQPVSI